MNSRLKTTIAPLFVLLGAMLWGTTGTAQAFAPNLANPLTIGAARITIGAFTLLSICLYRGTLKIDKSWPKLATLVSAISVAAYQPFFFSAVSKTGVAVGTVVAIGSSPIIAGFLSFVVRKEKLGKKWYLATSLSIIGILLLFNPSSIENVDSLGILLALGAGLSYAVFATASKQLLDKHPTEVVLAIVFSISAIILAPLFLIYDAAWLFELKGILVALHLGVFATALAYFLFSSGLKALPVATAVTLTLAEPLTATFLGIFLVGETLTFTSLIGVSLLFMGLVILSVSKRMFRKKERGEQQTSCRTP